MRIVPRTVEQIRVLNYNAEVSSILIKLLFPIPFKSALKSHTDSWSDQNLSSLFFFSDLKGIYSVG